MWGKGGELASMRGPLRGWAGSEGSGQSQGYLVLVEG